MHRKKCYSCFRPIDLCHCSLKDSVKINFNLVILMHPKEAYKQKVGTGRIANTLIDKAQIIVDASFEKNAKLLHILQNNKCYLLYPGAETITPKEFGGIANSEENITLLVVDGTWPCARKMLKISPNLHHLPRVSFVDTYKSTFTIKHQPQEGCLSTVESIYHVLNEANISDKRHLLLDSLHDLVSYQKQCANDPNRAGYRKSGSFKTPDMRDISKKWSTRSLIFDNI